MTENAATSALPATEEVLPAVILPPNTEKPLVEIASLPGLDLLLLAHAASLYANIVEAVRDGSYQNDGWLDTLLEQGSALRLLDLVTVTQQDIDNSLVADDLAAGDDVYQTTDHFEAALGAAYAALGVKF